MRYMSFSKYVSMLQKGALYFCSLGALEDPLEGRIPRGTIKNLESIRSQRVDYAARDGHDRAARAAALRVDDARRNAHVELDVLSDLPTWARQFAVSCWHRSADGSDIGPESIAMFQLYGDKRETIAIQSSIGRLHRFASGLPGVRLGDVNYHDWNNAPVKITSEMDLAFCKSKPYAHESEFRIVARRPRSGEADGAARGFYWSGDLSGLVKEAVVSPFADDWLTGVVAYVTTMAGYSWPVRRSDIRQA